MLGGAGETFAAAAVAVVVVVAVLAVEGEAVGTFCLQ